MDSTDLISELKLLKVIKESYNQYWIYLALNNKIHVMFCTTATAFSRVCFDAIHAEILLQLIIVIVNLA